jgi:hypothetical protein
MRLSFKRRQNHPSVPQMTAKKSGQVVALQPPLQCAEPPPSEMELEEDDIAWATRSGMWRNRVEKASARRTNRAEPAALINLAGHGVSLRIHGGALTIQNGFTHYPQTHARDNPIFPWRSVAA